VIITCQEAIDQRKRPRSRTIPLPQPSWHALDFAVSYLIIGAAMATVADHREEINRPQQDCLIVGSNRAPSARHAGSAMRIRHLNGIAPVGAR